MVKNKMSRFLWFTVYWKNMLSSVRLSVVCLSVCNIRAPYSVDGNFGNVSTLFGTLAICDLSIKNFTEIVAGNPSVGWLNRRGVAKYSDFGHFQGYISETVQHIR